MSDIVNEAIRRAVDDTNSQQEDGAHITDEDNQVLVGDAGTLDSLGILLFATAVETYMKPVQPNINLVDLLMSAENSVYFATIGSLKQYLRGIE